MGHKFKSFFKSESRYYIIASTPIIAVFFLIPFELYFVARQYWNWNYDIPVNFALAGIFVYLLLSIIIKISSRINPELAAYTSVFLFCLGLFVLLADVFSPLQTTLLDGGELAGEEPLLYSLTEGAILLVIIVVPLILGLRSTISVAVPLSMALLLTSGIYFGLIVTSSTPAYISKNRTINNDLIGNVYHILLDEMQTDSAIIYLEEKGAQKRFSGFTLFKNNISNYMLTQASLPSYITGTLYTEGSFKDWSRSHRKKGLFKDLYDKGYIGTF
jgi:hypothetical protein